MPALKVIIDFQENNKSIQGFPIEGRIVVDEVQSFNYEKAASTPQKEDRSLEPRLLILVIFLGKTEAERTASKLPRLDRGYFSE